MSGEDIFREAARSARETAALLEGLGDNERAEDLIRMADQMDADEALAKAIYTAHAKQVGPFMPSWGQLSEDSKESSRASARAARAHIAAEGMTEADARLLRNPESIQQIQRGLASTEGDVVIAGGAETVTAQPPVGSTVRDAEGDEWYHDSTTDWCLVNNDCVRHPWVHLVRDDGPLELVDEAKPADDAATWVPTPGQWAQIKPGAERGDVPESVERVLVLEADDPDDPLQVGWVGERDSRGDAWGCIPADSLAPVQPRVWARAEDVPLHVVVRDRNGIIAPRSVVGDEVLPFVGPYREVLTEDGAL